MEKRKILYLIDKLDVAGSQRHLVALLRGLDRERFEPSVACLMQEGVLAKAVRSLGIPVYALQVKRIYGISGVVGLIKLIQLLRKERFDILHSYMFSENILGAIASRLAKTPLVITGRRDTGILSEGKLRHFLSYRLTNRWVDRIVCVSDAIQRVVVETEKAPLHQLVTIPNGAQVQGTIPPEKKWAQREQQGISRQTLVVAIVANLSWVKDHETFLNAAAIVHQKRPDVRFWIIGEGPLRGKLEEQAATLGLLEKTRFFGRVCNPDRLLSLADVSVNASLSEGMSNTILESMALGLPVVATAVDGNPETVIDGRTGILVLPKDSKAMAEAILRLALDRSLAARMGHSGRERIRRELSLEKMVRSVQELYDDFFKPKVQFIFSKFPCYDETFLLREMKGIQKEGMGFSILSLKRGRDPVIHGDAIPLLRRVFYIPFIAPSVLWTQLSFLLRHPVRYVSTFFYVVFKNAKSPDFLLKSVALFPKSVVLAKNLERRRIRHLHAEWATHPATSALIASRLSGVPFSFTGHAHDIYRNTTMLAEKLQEASFVITCTEANKAHLLSLNPHVASSKILVNYHGVELERFRQNGRPANGKLSLLSVGSLLESKGFDTLIEACHELKKTDIPFECTIIGGGPFEKVLKRKINALDLHHSVRMLGYMRQEELIPYYQKADLFALPVRLDQHWGIPNVLLEAMASGACVVTTKLPSITELIRDRVNGILVQEKDPQALCRALLFLMKDASLRKALSETALQTVSEKFDAQKNAMTLVRLFRERMTA